jgi:malonyl-CoA O-methyltransferase
MITYKSEIGSNIKKKLNFSKYAHVYDKHAQLQNLMAEKLASFLPSEIPKQVLEVGCGTGLFTKHLLAKPVQKIFLNDISSEMIQRLKLNLTLPSYVETITGNAETIKFKMVDMVAANAVFQWFNNPKVALKHLKSFINPHGMLLFSTFGPSSLKEFRQTAKLASPVSLLTHEKWINLIKEAGFSLNSYKKENHKIFFPNTLKLLKNLQQIGSTPNRMTTSKELRQIINDYDQIYSTEKGVYARWELLYFSAIKI